MLKYSLSPNPFPNALPLSGATIPAGTPIYIYWEGTIGASLLPLLFTPSGQKESQAPYEYKGGQPVTFSQGTQIVEVFDKMNIGIETATFTVGSLTPPPSDTKKITWKLKSTGEIIGEFSYKESQTEIIIG